MLEVITQLQLFALQTRKCTDVLLSKKFDAQRETATKLEFIHHKL